MNELDLRALPFDQKLPLLREGQFFQDVRERNPVWADRSDAEILEMYSKRLGTDIYGAAEYFDLKGPHFFSASPPGQPHKPSPVSLLPRPEPSQEQQRAAPAGGAERPPQFDKGDNPLQALGKGFAGSLAQAAGGIATLTGDLTGWEGLEDAGSAIQEYGQENYSLDLGDYAEDPDLFDKFPTRLAHALGSFGSIIVPGLGVGGLAFKAAGRLGMSAMQRKKQLDGVLQALEKAKIAEKQRKAFTRGSFIGGGVPAVGLGVSDQDARMDQFLDQQLQLDEEDRQQISESKRLMMRAVGGAIGATEVIPFGMFAKVIRRIDARAFRALPDEKKKGFMRSAIEAFTGKGPKGWKRSAVEAFAGEGAQEALAGFLQNAAEHYGYNPEQGFTGSLLEDATYGGSAGAVVDMFMSVLPGGRRAGGYVGKAGDEDASGETDLPPGVAGDVHVATRTDGEDIFREVDARGIPVVDAGVFRIDKDTEERVPVDPDTYEDLPPPPKQGADPTEAPEDAQETGTKEEGASDTPAGDEGAPPQDEGAPTPQEGEQQPEQPPEEGAPAPQQEEHDGTVFGADTRYAQGVGIYRVVGEAQGLVDGPQGGRTKGVFQALDLDGNAIEEEGYFRVAEDTRGSKRVHVDPDTFETLPEEENSALNDALEEKYRDFRRTIRYDDGTVVEVFGTDIYTRGADGKVRPGFTPPQGGKVVADEGGFAEEPEVTVDDDGTYVRTYGDRVIRIDGETHQVTTELSDGTVLDGSWPPNEPLPTPEQLEQAQEKNAAAREEAEQEAAQEELEQLAGEDTGDENLQEEENVDSRGNFRFTEAEHENLDERTHTQQLKDTHGAMRGLVKTLTSMLNSKNDVARFQQDPTPFLEQMENDMPDIREQLSGYSGMGTLAKFLGTKWQPDYESIKVFESKSAWGGNSPGIRWMLGMDRNSLDAEPGTNKEYAEQILEMHARVAALFGEAPTSAARSTLTAYHTPLSIVRQMYDLAGKLGFAGGKVLDTSMGVGRFFGGHPHYTNDLTGIEVDPTAYAISRILYPKANIQKENFKVYLPNEAFDLVIGNPPYGNHMTMQDHRLGVPSLTVHNFFVFKSLKMLRPGGLGVFVVSSYFMDGQPKSYNDNVRRKIAEFADLDHAVRLNNTAFSGMDYHGTTDILVFRRRAKGEPPRPDTPFERIVDFQQEDGQVFKVNEFYAQHQGLLLYNGKMGFVSRGEVERQALLPREEDQDCG